MVGMTALNDITVLDLGQIYNGPYASFLLASAGARVIKVEGLVGEALRGRGAKSSAAYPFAMLNQGKESVTLNLKSEEGLNMFRRMVEKADVVLENYAPDTMTKLGIGAQELLALNPRLIYAAGSGYGRHGPHRDFLAMDITVQAMAGVMATTGLGDSVPLKAGPAICDFFGGVHLYGAITTALLQREKTGKGQLIDVAMQDTVLPTLATIIGAYYYQDRQLPGRHGNKHPALTMAPYNVYETTDGHVAIICIRDGHWRSLLTAMDRKDLLENEAYQTMADRAERMQEVDDIVGAWTSQLTKRQALERMQAQGVPSAMVRNIEEVLSDEHLHDRGMLREVTHPLMGEITLAGSPINMAFGVETPLSLAPALGEHNQAVFSDMLGIPDEELERLEKDGVIGSGSGGQ